jgi:acetoin utilization deacetylase AcuC-like enzyme
LREWAAKLEPAVDAFQPDFLLISAGFDARVGDPIGGLRWTDETFAEMTRRSMALAGKWCSGRVVSVLEGGYNPAGLASAALAHVRGLGVRQPVTALPSQPAAGGLEGGQHR